VINPNDKPACANPEYDPEWWYPESDYRTSSESMKEQLSDPNIKQNLENAIKALDICMGCPLMWNGACLDEAMKNPDTIDYGIWGGTLASERRLYANHKNTEVRHEYQNIIRHEATRRGITPVSLTPRKRGKVIE
jgi:Transcription factor WhiB